MSTVGDDLIESMVEASEGVRTSMTRADIEADLLHLSEASGFPYFFCRVDVRRRQTSRRNDCRLQLTNYPTDWLDVLQDSCYFDEDPIRKSIGRRFAAFSLEDLLITGPLAAETKRFGLGFGIGVHQQNQHGEHGYLLLAGLPALSGGAERDYIESRAMKHLWAVCEAARTIAETSTLRAVPRVAPAQLKALELCAHGYAIPKVADLMGTSESAVYNKLFKAQKRLGARNRNEAIARALVLQLIHTGNNTKH